MLNISRTALFALVVGVTSTSELRGDAPRPPTSVPYGLKLFEDRPRHDPDPELADVYVNPWGRSLQAGGCSPPTIFRASWSGLSADLNAVCGYFYWTGSYGVAQTVYSSPTYWTMTCGTGYYLVGPSTYGCTGAKTCQYDPSQNYYGSCSNVCNYQSSGGNCIYCCKCTTAWNFDSVYSSCSQCVPPAAPNAINPATVDGAYQYTWTCALGYYAAPVTRTCSSTGGGAWSGSAISCNVCPTPATPTNGYLSRPSTNDIWQFQCNPGYYNAAGLSVTQLRCLPNSASYTTSGSTITTCSPCTNAGAGYFCTGTAAPQQCAGGYFGTSGVIYSSSTCAGTCLAGYFCPPGSTSATQQLCGNAAVYCPAGSSQPIPVSAGYYTTPTTNPATMRTGQALCPAFRSCTNGVIDPAVVLDPNVCINGKIVGAAVQEFFSFAPFQGGVLGFTTPGYTGAVNWVVDNVVPADPVSCKITASNFAFSGGASAAASPVTLTTSSIPLIYGNCSDGFTIYFSAVRSNDVTLKASCQAFTQVLQVARPPVITDCRSRSVNERSLLGTAVGTPLGAINPNVGTSLLWYINTTATGPVPFSIGMCDGQIRVLRNILYTQGPQYWLDLTIRNDGSSIGIGSVDVTCRVQVNITQVPVPPVIANTGFYVPELVPIGTWVGNLGISDPSNFTITSRTFGVTDVPNLFALNATSGDIYTTGVPDALTMQKSTWTYYANVTNSIGTKASEKITINLIPVPRPPSTAAQTRTVAENIRTGTALPPALFATHPQGLNLTFAVTPNNVFDCYANGTVYLKAGPLDYYAQNVYTLTIIVTDTNGRTASAPLTITLTSVPRPPYWTYGTSTYTFEASEGMAYRAPLRNTGASSISASNIDPSVTIVYRITASNPSSGNGMFAVDPFTGAVTVGPNVAQATGYIFDSSLVYPQLQTFQLSIAAVDGNGLSVNGTLFIKVVNIQPRILFPPAIASGGFSLSAGQLDTAGSLVANISQYVWSPYPTQGAGGTPYYYTMIADGTAEGDTAFVIDSASGVISLANNTYANNGTGFYYGPARFNYNTRNVFSVTVNVTQGALQRSVTFNINLPHTNRPPVFTRFPTLFAQAGTAGTVGSALYPSVVYDADALLAFVNEHFTFSILAGNTDSTFNITAATGQIQVANPLAPAFQYVPGGRNQFNLTIQVTDAGIDGPAYSAVGWVLVNMTYGNFAPVVNYHNFSIPEHRPYGTFVGILNATDRNIGQKLTYRLDPRGRNVNRPFPFNVTTSYAPQYSNVQGVGIITVARDPTDTGNIGLDVNEAFTLYYATVTVTDDDGNPLASTANVEIYVTWVPEPPYFRTAIVFTPNEHSAAGTVVGQAVGWSKDIWQRPLLTYSYMPGKPAEATARSYFAISSNGTITYTAAGGAADLSVITTPNFTVTVLVTDTNGLTGNTTVLIRLVDVPEPAKFVGLYNPANTLSVGTQMTVSESVSVGSIVGYLRVKDDDAVTSPLQPWGGTYFSLVPTTDSPYFTVDPQTGALRTARGLDFWDQTSFNVSVSVADGLAIYTSIAYFNWTVVLTQVNTVAVTGFYVDGMAPAATAVNASGTNGVQALFSTLGFRQQYLYIYGANLGPTARRMAREGIPLSATRVTASYGPGGRYKSWCSVVVPNTVVACNVSAGIGTGHQWTVSINGMFNATTLAATGYFQPTIQSVYVTGGNVSNQATQTIPTPGTGTVDITALNIGPIDTQVYLYYGRLSKAGYEWTDMLVTQPKRLPCTMITEQSLVRCPTAQGLGAGLKWAIEVAGQMSADFTSSPVVYTPPRITRVSAPVLATGGSQRRSIVINGTNFGPDLQGLDISVAYSFNFGNPFYTQFVARNCRIDPDNPHIAAICDPDRGVGTGLAVRITIGGQTSSSSNDTLAYVPPTIAGIAGPGVRKALTVGGQDVTITGTSFGPVTPIFTNGTAVPGDLQPLAFYGPGGTAKYAAANCRVVTADTTITCKTVEGVGYNLLWSVRVGGQGSGVLTSDSSDYHPPIVASYSRPNGSDVQSYQTYGGEEVLITGANFGPLGTPIDSATYGNDENGTQFSSPQCALVAPHSLISCRTDIGAGAGLKWFLTIGGQRSVTPTVAYGAPVVTTFSGPGAVDASTDGGEAVTLYGEFFSINKYLDYVTYGPNGVEFKASGCSLSMNHTQITCYTRPGVGRALKWYVSVGKQLSHLSDNFTSYAVPIITYASRLNATTAGRDVATNLPVTVTISGTNFALNYPSAATVVKIDNLGSARPAQAAIDAHWQSIYAGGTGDAAVAAWIDGLTSLYPNNPRTTGPGQHSLEVTIPEGFGSACDMFVLAGGIPSLPVKFQYLPPAIKLVAPDRQNTTSPTQLRVFVEGTSFCSGYNGCGRVKVNNVTVPHSSWSHTSILFYVETNGSSTVTVEVAGMSSAPEKLDRPVPNINALVTQNVYVNMDTRGGQTFVVRGILDVGGINDTVVILIGGRVCTDAWGYIDNGKPANDKDVSYTMVCTTPAGVGADHDIRLRYQNLTSADSVMRFSYGAPVVTTMEMLVPFYDAQTAALALTGNLTIPDSGALITGGIPTLGAVVALNGLNMGTPDLGIGLLIDQLGGGQVTILTQNHTRVVAVIGVGDGQNHGLRYFVGDQGSNLVPFAYAPPTVTSLAPNHGPTLGGQVIQLLGYNFGLTKPSVVFGASVCNVSDPFTPSANHSLITCISPAGQGRNIPVTVTVNGQPSLLPAALWSFDPPDIYAVVPATAPTSGRMPGPFSSDGVHRLPGPRVIQTLNGRNFGTYGRVSYLPGPRTDTLSQGSNFTVLGQDILFWNDSMIQYYVPEGYGSGLVVSVFVDQESNTQVEFSYDAPMIEAVVRFDRTVSQCNDYELCFYYGNTTRCRMQPAGCYDTRGGYPLELVGSSFGKQDFLRTFTQIFVGSKPCVIPSDPNTVAALSHTRLVCNAPVGLGEDLPVTIIMGSRMSQPSPNATFSYDPPQINLISPNTPDATGVQPLQIRGKNFGFDITPLMITINDEACTTQEWLNDAQLKCSPPGQVVGAKNVSILVANRTQPSLFYDLEEQVVYQCAKDFYGLEGELCLECPQGAKCPGAERRIDLVNATAGFWRFNYTVDSEEAGNFCDAPRRTTREACPAFLPCGPPEACLVGNICAEGYEGERCAYCLAGKYYRQNDACVKCPNNLAVLYAGIAIMFLLITAFAWFLNKRNVSLALISVGVDWAQVMSMFARTKIRWPTLLKQLFQILSAFNLNLEITAPECLNPGIQFWQKWYFIECIPLAVAGILATVYFVRYAYKAMFLNVKKAQRGDHLPQMVSTFIVLFRVLYLYITKTSFDVLNCTPTDPPTFRDPIAKKGSIEFMSGLVQPEYECWAPRSWQVFLFPFGVGTLVTYTFVVPGVALWKLRNSKFEIKYDQILRAKGTGDDRLTNPHYEFRQMWQKLYYHYLPGKWYWEFCITARKMFIAGTSLAFRQIPSYQLAIALLVLFAAYVLHVLHWPYMSHTTRDGVVEDHALKANYDKLHIQIEQDMQAMAKRNQRKRHRANIFEAGASRKSFNDNAALLIAFDANTVESILLGSCVLVSLAGIMLDSKRFDGDNWYIPQVQREYTGLTFGCLMIIVASIIYYAVVFTIEMCLIFCPDFVPVLLSSCRSRAIAKEKAKARGSHHHRNTGNIDDEAGIVVNPILLKQEQAQISSVSADSLLGEAGILDAAQLLKISSPTPAMWSAVQGSYGRLMNMTLSLREQLRDAKHDTERAVAAAKDDAAASTPAHRVPRARKQFGPTSRRTEGEDGAAAAVGGLNGSTPPSPSHGAGLAGFKSNALKTKRAAKVVVAGTDGASSSDSEPDGDNGPSSPTATGTGTGTVKKPLSAASTGASGRAGQPNLMSFKSAQSLRSVQSQRRMGAASTGTASTAGEAARSSTGYTARTADDPGKPQ